MKYYSEDTVKKIIADTLLATLHISTPIEDYPYIELPEKHGRLIDGDAIRKSLSTDCPCHGCERFHEEGACMNCQWERFAKLIDDAEVVLERT